VSPIVLDTNIVLDLWLFDDAAAKPLRAQLEGGQWQWLATPSMREELERVLDYAHIVPKLAHYGLSAETLLSRFDAHVALREVAPKASAVCKDPDDQKFIDLAVAHQAVLLSKDKAVLCMRKRLLGLGVVARAAIE
jgi:putative PIN family toxin of toxin-antitoxin system